MNTFQELLKIIPRVRRSNKRIWPEKLEYGSALGETAGGRIPHLESGPIEVTSMQLRLLIPLVLLAASALCRSVSGVGGLHTVAADAYVQMAGNQGEFRAGERYPDFRAVCVVGRFRDRDDFEGSGVLVAPRWVLSVAHCVLKKKKAPRFARNLKVRFGLSSADRSQEYRVVDIRITLPLDAKVLRPLISDKDPKNGDSSHADRNDIALLKLDRDVEGIPVAALFEGRATPGVRICLAGYGCFATGLQKREKRWKDDGLKRAGENILDRDGNGLIAFDFDNGQPERNTLKNNRLLDKSLSKILGPGKSEARPLPLEGCCYSGDSGGPIYARENGQWRVLGVNSFGTDYPLRGRRATTQYGDVNCSTRVPDHLDWIRRTMAGGPR